MGYERVQPVTGGETAISRLFPHPARFAGVLGARDFNIHGPNWTIALPALILWFSLPRDRQQQFRSGTHANFYQREGLILGNSPVPQRRGIIKRRSFLSTAFSTARTRSTLGLLRCGQQFAGLALSSDTNIVAAFLGLEVQCLPGIHFKGERLVPNIPDFVDLMRRLDISSESRALVNRPTYQG